MLDFMIICNDNGELKTVTATELQALVDKAVDHEGHKARMLEELDDAINAVLDGRAAAETRAEAAYEEALIEVDLHRAGYFE